MVYLKKTRELGHSLSWRAEFCHNSSAFVVPNRGHEGGLDGCPGRSDDIYTKARLGRSPDRIRPSGRASFHLEGQQKGK